MPCRLTFSSSDVLVAKAKKLIELLELDKMEPGMADEENGEEKNEKGLREKWMRERMTERDEGKMTRSLEYMLFGFDLEDIPLIAQKEIISVGQCLTDNHMNFINDLLKNLFPHRTYKHIDSDYNPGSSLKSNSSQVILQHLLYTAPRILSLFMTAHMWMLTTQPGRQLLT